MRKRWNRCLAMLLSVMLAAGSTGCGTTETETVPELLEPAGIRSATEQVERGSLYDMKEISVMALPVTEELSFEPSGSFSGGQISEICVVPGDMVEEGQVLVILDQTNVDKQIASLKLSLNYTYTIQSYALKQAELDVEIAQTEKDAADTALSEAQKALQEAQSSSQDESSPDLSDENSSGEEQGQENGAQSGNNGNAQAASGDGSGQDPEESSSETADLTALNAAVENAQYEAQLAEISLRQAQAAYDQLKADQASEVKSMNEELADLQASKECMELKAPFSGRITELYFEENDWVSSYETVMILADESQIVLKGEAYSNSSLMNALKIDAQIGQNVYAVDYQAYDSEDYLKRKLNGEDLPSLFVLSENETKSLSYGQIGTVRVYSAISENTLVLPIACLKEDSIGYFVYLDADGQREKTYVSVGIKTTTSAEILDGLEEGDLVYVGE